MKPFRTILSLYAMALAMAASAQPYAGPPRIVEIDTPRMTVFLPARAVATGRAVVALPGGGYRKLVVDREGWDWAPFFNDMGIALAVVEYTLPTGNPSLPFNDATAAIKVMRDSAECWGINPHEVGIMGGSAGGHLAATVATHAVGAAKPDFQILFYPVISMTEGLAHKGSRANLLGDTPSDSEVASYSNELQVTGDTPRALLLLSDDDELVAPTHSILYYQALHAAGVPASIIIYPDGGHGWGHRLNFKYHDVMLDQLRAWLNGF